MGKIRTFDEVLAWLPEIVATRHELHRLPEIGLAEFRTSDLIAGKLVAMGWTVTRGLAGTGLVASMTCGDSGRSVGIRADFDALPITEATGLPHASTHPGVMHACGHDGHSAILLGAARILAERRRFDGTVHLIFQPAEENFGGALLMIRDGLFERFPCDAIFALHNDPRRPFGHFALREGPIMAAIDEARITVRGRGGHGAEPQSACDPIVAGAGIVMALQTIVSRNIHPHDPAVITVGAFNGGHASNVIPDKVELVVGIRSFDPNVRDELERRIRLVAERQAESFGLEASVAYERSYEPTINPAVETAYVRDLARRLHGVEKVVDLARPDMGSEDFGYMLKERPGAFFFLGTARGDDDPPLHHPGYDFNDDILPIAVSFWVDLVEDRLGVVPTELADQSADGRATA